MRSRRRRTAPTSFTTAPTGGRLLLRMVSAHRARLLVFLVLMSTWQVCEALVPVLIGVTIDRAVVSGDLGQLVWWLAVMTLLFVVLSYSHRIGAQVAVRVVQESMHQLRMAISRKALDPRGVRSRLLPGETLSLATSDVELIGVAVRVAGYAVASATATLVAAVLLLRIDLVLGLVVLLGMPTLLAALQLLTPVIGRRSATQQATLARATGVATDLVRGFRTLKGIGAEGVAASRYRRESARARDAGVRTADAYGVLTGATTGAAALFLAVVALLAGVLAVDGRITIGELVAIVGLTQFLAEPMRILGDLLAELATARASAQRIVDYLRSPPQVLTGDQHDDPVDDPGDARDGGPATRRDLELHDLHAGSLRGLTLGARPGELLGVVVVDTLDAAALVGAVTGEVAPRDPASVRLDDIALSEHSVASRRRRLLVAPHRVDLFEGTIADNIDPESRHRPETMAALVGAAAVEDVLRLHHDGLERAVTPDGATYSGGQRQRLAFARALATEAPVLVLHDPTTAVDAVTEHRMAAGLREVRHTVRRDLTTWVLTSSPALLALADRVVLVVDGQAVAEGTHAALGERHDYQQAVLR